MIMNYQSNSEFVFVPGSFIILKVEIFFLQKIAFDMTKTEPRKRNRNLPILCFMKGLKRADKI